MHDGLAESHAFTYDVPATGMQTLSAMQSGQRSGFNGVSQWVCSCTSQASFTACSASQSTFGEHLVLSVLHYSVRSAVNVALQSSMQLLQAYELVQGALVRWSEQQAGQRPPPTAVMVHGILGSRKNMQAYAHRLVEVCKHPQHSSKDNK